MGHVSSLGRQGGRKYPQLHGVSVCGWLPAYGTTVTVVVDPAPIIVSYLSLKKDIIVSHLRVDPNVTISGLEAG